MEKQDIFLFRFNHNDNITHIQKGILRLIESIELEKIFSPEELVAVKVHVGEKGNSSHVNPDHIKPIIDFIKSKGAKPFLADTNVLYKSERDNAFDHMILAYKHGFSIEKIGAPFIVADGIAGRNELPVEINAPLNNVVYIASEFLVANSIVVVSHATGHIQTGIGATIKNIGMGMASRKGKLVQHSVSKPTIKQKLCTGCGVCIKWCPEDAIAMENSKARIIEEKCIGCGECLAVCRLNAVKFKWDRSSGELQKQIAEHAYAVVKSKKGKIAYITFLVTMTKDCDCMAQPEKYVVDDIGVIAGYDPVAMDQAVLDLTKNKSGRTLAEASYPGINPEIQLEYGEKIGLGSRNYRLIEIKA